MTDNPTTETPAQTYLRVAHQTLLAIQEGRHSEPEYTAIRTRLRLLWAILGRDEMIAIHEAILRALERSREVHHDNPA